MRIIKSFFLKKDGFLNKTRLNNIKVCFYSYILG